MIAAGPSPVPHLPSNLTPFRVPRTLWDGLPKVDWGRKIALEGLQSIGKTLGFGSESRADLESHNIRDIGEALLRRAHCGSNVRMGHSVFLLVESYLNSGRMVLMESAFGICLALTCDFEDGFL